MIFKNLQRITQDEWSVNVIRYYAVLTVLDKNDSLNDENTKADKRTKLRWLDFHEQRINNIKPNISYISVILQCQNSNTALTKHQKSIQY